MNELLVRRRFWTNNPVYITIPVLKGKFHKDICKMISLIFTFIKFIILYNNCFLLTKAQATGSLSFICVKKYILFFNHKHEYMYAYLE